MKKLLTLLLILPLLAGAQISLYTLDEFGNRNYIYTLPKPEPQIGCAVNHPTDLGINGQPYYLKTDTLKLGVPLPNIFLPHWTLQDTLPPIYVDQNGYIKLRPNYIYRVDSTIYNIISKDTTVLNVIPKDTVVLNVIPKDTTVLRIAYKDTTIIKVNYKDTCYTAPVDTTDNGGGPVVDPPPVTGEAFAFTVQQRSLDNIARPFGGIEFWHDQNIASLPYTPADVYFRLSIAEVQTGRGVYNWATFDRWFTDAIARGRKLSFGFMTVYPDAPTNRRTSYSGSYSAIPGFWFEDMTADGLPGWRSSNSGWIPNYNAPSYWKNLQDFNAAVYAHIVEKGWKGWVNTVDIRGMGAYGEWHHYPYAQTMSAFPAGTRPTEAGMRQIIDAHIKAFPDLWLVAMISGFDANRLQNTMNPPGIRDYLLTARNEKGLLGWRRDNWGATDSYITQYLSDTRALDRWKHAPVLGEPCCNSGYAALPAQVSQYHAVSFGNGNYGTVTASNVQEAARRAGHRLTITGGQYKDGTVTVNWRNDGITPIYEDFDVIFELRTSSGQVAKSITAKGLVTMKLPGSWTTSTTFSGLPAGTYELHIFVKNEQRSYPLGIVGSKVATVKI